jgi:hypothetical protein
LKFAYLLSLAALGAACESGPTDAIKLFPGDAGGMPGAGGANGGKSEGGNAEGGRAEGGRAEGGRAEGGRADGGRAEGGPAEGGTTVLGSGGASQTGSGGDDNPASSGGASAGSSEDGSGGVNPLGGRTGQGGGCQSDNDCAAPTPACNLTTHICRICNKDSQCPSPQHCEVSEGHCE